MNRSWKTASVVAVLLLLPATAYAVGAITAPVDEPTPRRDITIIDRAEPAQTPSRTARPATPGTDGAEPPRNRGGNTDDREVRDDDDRVRVVTPRPAPVDKAGGVDRDDDGPDDRDDDDDGPDDDDGDDDD